MAIKQVPDGLIATIGISGSGKTTWTLHRLNDEVCRANRDALRIAHFGKRTGTRKQEAVVTDAQREMIRSAFEHGYRTVIVDDTNLHGVSGLKSLAAELGVPFSIQDFRTVPLETCIRRDAAREGAASVGEDVIRNQYAKIQGWLRDRAREANRGTR